MGNCRFRFKPSKMRTIAVKKRTSEQKPTCKEELDSLVSCWRTSGTDSRNCSSLVVSLVSCISNIKLPSSVGVSGSQIKAVNSTLLTIRASMHLHLQRRSLID